MLSETELEQIRRSAAMGSLTAADQRRLVDACCEMSARQAQIASVLAELPTSWASVRAALNRLQALVRDVSARRE
jgi:ribosomal protein RSM22 (predicted rRNA methylase)